MIETRTSFPCFGGTCAISVLADADARAAVTVQRARLVGWHDRFTCFDPGSELMRLNADPRGVVPARGDLRRFAAAIRWAQAFSGGLVDATGCGARIRVDDATIRRPAGAAFDSGGLKGVFADWVAEALPGHAVAVDCAGDMRVRGMAREVHVARPRGGPPLHTFVLAGDAAIATSGIGRLRGRPADSGVVQATAVAPTALEADVRAKAALLDGPRWLAHGGVLLHEDGSAEVLPLAAVGRDGGDDRVAGDEVERVVPLAQLARLRVA
jgi:thiamine biosynthesis lipoprotein